MDTHRYWTGPPDPSHRWTLNAVRSAAPGQVIDWNDSNLPVECLAEAADAEGKVRKDDGIRHRANVIRWWLLLEVGGWWVDHDLIPLQPFLDLPFPVTASHGETRCNSFMGFPAGHGLPELALKLIRKAPLGTGTSAEVSGELLLTRLQSGFDVATLPLPFDARGRRLPGNPWAVHLYESARREAP